MNRNDLEEKCKRLLNSSRPHDLFALPSLMIEREMALTLEHLNRSRRRKSKLLNELESISQEIGNRLVNLRRLPHEPPELWIDRDKIRNQLTTALVRLESQKIRIVSDYEREMQSHEIGLLKLLNKHEQLNMHNGNPGPTSET